jgi:hypothetical protein
MRLFVRDDWAEDDHDVELMDAAGRVLARKRLPEGVAGMARLHALIGEQLGGEADDSEVVIGTGTDRGPWVAALVAAGYTVYGVNPLQASRYRERHGVSGTKSDTGDSHMLTDMVRTDSHQLRAGAPQCGRRVLGRRGLIPSAGCPRAGCQRRAGRVRGARGARSTRAPSPLDAGSGAAAPVSAVGHGLGFAVPSGTRPG